MVKSDFLVKQVYFLPAWISLSQLTQQDLNPKVPSLLSCYVQRLGMQANMQWIYMLINKLYIFSCKTNDNQSGSSSILCRQVVRTVWYSALSTTSTVFLRDEIFRLNFVHLWGKNLQFLVLIVLEIYL
jgi:hypothetical protein